MAPASSLMYAGSGTLSIIHKLSDFKGFRCHKNVTIISIKSILNCPPTPHHHVTILITYPFPHYQQLIFGRCCCTREKGRTLSPHPHVTILITYPFPHYQQLIFGRCCCTREKGRTLSPHPHVTILITYPFPHYQQLIFSRCCCTREKGRTLSPHPHVTILIT